MRKIILHNSQSPGDLVMLTAAVRDLHRYYPGRFRTDVRAPCPELWEHNPFIKRLKDSDGDVQSVQCHYPLVHRSNQSPYHFLHGFIEFLNERLQVRIGPTDFKGDLYLSDGEKQDPVFGQDKPALRNALPPPFRLNGQGRTSAFESPLLMILQR